MEQPSAIARSRHGFRNRLSELIRFLPRDCGDAYLGFYEGLGDISIAMNCVEPKTGLLVRDT